MTSAKTAENELLNRATEITENNLENEQFGVSELARELGMSRSNLHRRIKASVNSSVSQFIRNIRLEHARQLLRDKGMTTSEVAYKTGFSSVSYFNKCFKLAFGITPGELGSQVSDSDMNSSEMFSENQTRKGGSRLIVKPAYIILLLGLILAVFIYGIYKRTLDNSAKSIAILPFLDESPAEWNAYIVFGLREEIMDRLYNVEDLEIASGSSADQFMSRSGNYASIGKALSVNYILEGSAQTVNGHTRIWLQLVDVTSNKFLWSRAFGKDITIDNIFQIQEEVANVLAEDLNTILSK